MREHTHTFIHAHAHAHTPDDARQQLQHRRALSRVARAAAAA
jgi:hypothetical protein